MPPSDGFRIASRVELRHQHHPATMPVPTNAIATLRLDYYLPYIIDYLNFTGNVIHTRGDYNYEWIFIRELVTIWNPQPCPELRVRLYVWFRCVAVPIALQIRASLGQPTILPTGNMDLYRAAGRWWVRMVGGPDVLIPERYGMHWQLSQIAQNGVRAAPGAVAAYPRQPNANTRQQLAHQLIANSTAVAGYQ
ncbi:unnamed protein product [Vitrella brassicaformis CCMP3155]|uniref:Uncharacterized protein n=1 Tax=Vitrella brassicaformis (strain CCMP3155) TaxID=1169540 RepID=A0A0G4E867_VITBC|nr:unnamed protein product [Vitrella brassicaformis CCMP3155]|eukprot:CEL91708.1 unnamed protein product [Vitrella brassicaformis CCMP3155]